MEPLPFLIEAPIYKVRGLHIGGLKTLDLSEVYENELKGLLILCLLKTTRKSL